MEVLDRAALGLGEAAEMHEAGHVDADEQIWLDVENSVEFEIPHPPRNVWEGDGEGAAESATLLGLTEGHDLSFFDVASRLRTASPVPVPRAWQERWKARRVGLSNFPGQVFTPKPL